MRVTFRVNLGSRHAEAHGLDHKQCCAGMQRDVPDKTGQWLIRQGIATETQATPVATKPAEIFAVPETPAIGETQESSIKAAETRAARRADQKATSPKKDNP